MRKWDTADEIEMLGRAVDVLQKGGVLAPASLGLPSPLDLRGLVFPSVSQLTIADLPATVAKMIIGRREFNNAILQDVDLRDANLSFSAWHNCVFERVCFDKASMKQARFFGCRFANCSFRSADLRDASFTIGCDGAETEVCDTALYRANFRGASCSNPVFRSTSFANCKLEGFVFDGALCDNVSFCGSLEELTFRGLPNGGDRNCVRIDLSRASIIWLNVDYGIDLHRVILPSDDSCLILRSRLRAIECIGTRLSKETGKAESRVANVLEELFSDRAMSALDPSQDMVLISKGMIADFAETDAVDIIDTIFNRMRAIADSGGYLVVGNGR